jgi:hypothetical protein
MGRAMVDRETLRIDGAVPNLGEFAACRDVAQTIYLALPHSDGR